MRCLEMTNSKIMRSRNIRNCSPVFRQSAPSRTDRTLNTPRQNRILQPSHGRGRRLQLDTRLGVWLNAGLNTGNSTETSLARLFRRRLRQVELHLNRLPCRLTSDAELDHDHILSRRNLISLRSIKIEHDARNRRIAKEQPRSNTLQRAAIHFERMQFSRRKRARKINHNAVRPSNRLRVGRDRCAGCSNLHFHRTGIATHRNALHASVYARISRRTRLRISLTIILRLDRSAGLRSARR